MRLRRICLMLTFTIAAGLPQGLLWAQTGPAVAILDSANTKYYFGLHYPSCSLPGSYYLGADEYQR